MGAELQTFTLQENQLQAKLAEMQAIPYPDRSSNLRHVYFSRSMGLWIGVSRRGSTVELSLFETCPCSGG